jgi:hypothetical protein
MFGIDIFLVALHSETYPEGRNGGVIIRLINVTKISGYVPNVVGGILWNT